jgi:putative ABC transport system permease protein
MKFLPLVWAGLWRKRVRTVLAMLSVAIAFMLYGTLDGVTAGFDHAVDRLTDATQLRTTSRVNVLTGLPFAHRARIESVPGVREVGVSTLFAGYYRELANDVSSAAIDIERVHTMLNVEIDPEHVEAMRRTRTGAIIGPELVDRYGWKIGDRVTLTSRAWTQANGSNDWAFDIVGVYSIPEGTFPADGNFWINYDYFDEARAHAKGTVHMYTILVADAAQTAEVSRTIDALFANSANETLTQTMRDFIRAQLDRIGDIDFIVNSMIGAVLFALLFVTGNTMMQSIRERVPELAVLKTYGYSDAAVTALVLAEAGVLCLTAAAAGLALAAGLFPTIYDAMGVAPLPLEASTLLWGAGLAVAFALVSAAPPVWRLRRLKLVDALAGR